MSAEEPKLRPDTDPPDADEQWAELQQRLEGRKTAETTADGDEEIEEGNEVASALRSQTKRALDNIERLK